MANWDVVPRPCPDAKVGDNYQSFADANHIAHPREVPPPGTRLCAMPDPETASPTCTQPEAVIDLAAIAHNTALLAKAARGAQLMALVKAQGFGHGAVHVARTALKNGASWLGVASPAEAMALRHQGIDAPLLTWLYAPSEDLAQVIRASIDVSVASLAHLYCLAEAAWQTGHTASVHLKVDTGLSRSGALPSEWSALVAAARRLEEAGSIRVAGIWSHLSNAEEVADPSVSQQIQLFNNAIEIGRKAGLSPTLYHLANSAGILQLPQTHFNLVRAGIALYGIEPIARGSFGLRPAMTLRSPVILTKRVPAGTWVSYGRSYATRQETTLALLPIGFADGLPRAASQQASLVINGARCSVAGVIAMDQLVIDVGNLHVRTGDTAVLFGPGDAGEPTVRDWANWAGTNPHEILTGIGSRVRRKYLPVNIDEIASPTEREPEFNALP
jgi:alanine racemase